MVSQPSGIIQRLEEVNNYLKNEIAELQSVFNRTLDNMYWSIKRNSLQPVVRTRNDTNEEAQTRQHNVKRGILIRRPKEFYVVLCCDSI